MSIRWKLALLLSASGAFAAGVGLFAASELARHAIRTAAKQDFSRLGSASQAALAPRLAELEEDVGTLARDSRYSACLALALQDQTDFAAAAGDVRAANLCLTEQALHTRWGSSFVLLNDEGHQIVRAEDEQADIGRDLSGSSAVRSALHGHAAFQADVNDDSITLAVPVRSPEGRFLGVALAGLPLTELLASIGKSIGADLAVTPKERPGDAREVRMGNAVLLEQVGLLSDPGGHPLVPVRVRRNLTSLVRPFDRALRRAAWLGLAGGLLFALLLALFAADRATRSLGELVRGTEAISAGKYDTRLAAHGRDELGTLARSFNAMAEGLSLRVFFESALRRYLAPAAVDELLRDPTRMELGGQRRELSVLFFDVQGFTRLSETLPPVELVALCNGYLDRVVEALFAAGGTLDKFIGDAVMALFGAPLDQPDHAARACRAALSMQAAFQDHVARAASPDIRALRARVGIHSGFAAFGNLGARSIMSLTAMGDAVNLASRLEGVNKVYGTRSMASEATVTAAAGAVATRELDLVRVVGRQEPVRIFELLSTPGPSPELLLGYARGLVAYRAARFAEAAELFEAVAAQGDAPAAVLAARSRAHERAPPPAGWDGAYALDHK
ncbi:MAG: adenylate/guanylate cyclase domain-containing protein [Deltaproteobacteria bacterium]